MNGRGFRNIHFGRKLLFHLGAGLVVTILAGCRAPAEPSATPVPTTVPTEVPTDVPSIPPPSIEHRIGVRVVDGDGEFYDRRTGETFIPRGYNYVRMAKDDTTGRLWEATFSPGLYDPALAEETLQDMHAGGYNVVRVNVDCCRTGNNVGHRNGGLSPAYIDNVVDFLNKAKKYEIYVLFILHLTPADGGYTEMWDHCCNRFAGANMLLLTQGGLADKARYDTDFITALIRKDDPLEYVLGYDLTNDLVYEASQPPLSLTAGRISTPNGGMYDMSDPEDKIRMMEENLIFWIDRQRDAILEVDPKALVTVSFPAFIVDERPTFPAAVIRESTADFIDLHVYLGMGLSLEEYVDQFGIAGQTEKPLIMGQFGAARQGYPTVSSAAQALVDWQQASCRYGIDGWLLWFRGSEEYLGMFSGPGDGGFINDVLAPVNNPDPCHPTVVIPEEETVGLPPVVPIELTPAPAPVLRSGWTSFASIRGVRDLAFDHGFNVWTATSGGAVVYREDGTYTQYTWEHGLATNSVQTVAVAADGAVWFGTYGGGVSRFDGETWQTYTEADGLAGDHVISSAAASDGSVWFGTIYSGVSRFDGESWTSYSYGVTPGFEAVGPVIDIAAGPDGSIWIVAYGGGITHFDGRDWQSYEDENGMLEDGLYFNVTVSDGELWAGAASGDREAGLVHFDGSTWTSHIAPSSHVTGTIWAIAAGPDGTIWLSTGAAVLAFDGENWRTIEIPDVNAIEVRRDGTVWFGTGLQGLLILSEQNIMALAGDDFLSPYGASSIAAGPAGDLWFAGLDGIAHFDGDRWHRYTSTDGLPADDVDVVVVDPDGSVWVGTDFGAAYFFDGHWTAFTAANSGLVNDDVEALAIGPDGAVWFGTMGGVSRFDGEIWSTYTTADGLAADWVFGVAVDDQGVAWLDTTEGISRFDGETWTTFNEEDGLYNLNEGSLTIAPDGAVWVGRINGLAYFDGETWTSLSIESEFDSPSVTAIAFAPDGTLWCSLRSLGPHPSYGVGRFDGATWTFYSVGDGLGHVDVNTIAVALDGAVWFGTLAGASRFSPEE